MPIPLPQQLDGAVVERTIRVDRALLYLVSGALIQVIADEEIRHGEIIPVDLYEQTGTLTPEEAIDALHAMLQNYFT